jgi:hypothetical protein
MYRFQGVALPKGIFLNHFAFGVLEKRAAKLVNLIQLILRHSVSNTYLLQQFIWVDFLTCWITLEIFNENNRGYFYLFSHW